jgi:hypothetical protein
MKTGINHVLGNSNGSPSGQRLIVNRLENSKVLAHRYERRKVRAYLRLAGSGADLDDRTEESLR